MGDSMVQRFYDMRQVLLHVGVPKDTASVFEHILMPFDLKPHQFRSLQGILAWQRMGLFDSARTGKTIVMHLAAIYFARHGIKSIFLMPPVLFDQFLEQLDMIGNHGYRVGMFNGAPAARKSLLTKLSNPLNQDTAEQGLAMTKEIFKKHWVELASAGFTALFYDECHMGLQKENIYVKGRKRTNEFLTTYGCVRRFCEVIPDARLVLATGTPIYNEIYGVYPLISLKTPNAYESRREFDYEHVTFTSFTVDTRRGPTLVQKPDKENYRNLKLFSENLHSQATRASQMDVLDIGVPNVAEVLVNLHSKHRNAYKRLMRARIVETSDELIDARNNSMLVATALRMITDPTFALPDGEKVKNAVLEAILALFDSVNVNHNKIVLFANLQHSVRFLYRELSKYKPAIVYGPNGPKKNRLEVNLFLNDPACRILIANPLAGGVGLTLGKVSRTVIFVEPVSTPGQFEQVASRVILSGQTEPVVVYILKILRTISVNAIDSMRGRSETVLTAMRDRKSLLDAFCP